MLPSKRPLDMGNTLSVALKIGNINIPTRMYVPGPGVFFKYKK